MYARIVESLIQRAPYLAQRPAIGGSVGVPPSQTLPTSTASGLGTPPALPSNVPPFNPDDMGTSPEDQANWEQGLSYYNQLLAQGISPSQAAQMTSQWLASNLGPQQKLPSPSASSPASVVPTTTPSFSSTSAIRRKPNLEVRGHGYWDPHALSGQPATLKSQG